MTEGGFFEQRRRSPTSLALVITLHAAALGALALMKAPEVIRHVFPRTKVVFVSEQVEPPPIVEPQPETDALVTMTRPQPIVERPPIDPPGVELGATDTPIIPPLRDNGTVTPPRPPQPMVEPVREPVRIAALVDPRYADALQPPYPPTELRAGRGGTVEVQVTIGPDGRVRAIERISATSDAFWAATRRHALARWRFRPATVDGRPVESTKRMTLVFRLEGRA